MLSYPGRMPPVAFLFTLQKIHALSPIPPQIVPSYPHLLPPRGPQSSIVVLWTIYDLVFVEQGRLAVSMKCMWSYKKISTYCVSVMVQVPCYYKNCCSVCVLSCSLACCVYSLMHSMPSGFLTIMLRFTDGVSHSCRSQEWPHSYCNHHRPNTIRAYQVTCLAKPGATEPFITATRHVITMMARKIIKFGQYYGYCPFLNTAPYCCLVCMQLFLLHI